MRKTRQAVLARLVLTVPLLAGTVPAKADADKPDVLTRGVPFDGTERQEAWDFCVATLAAAKQDFARPDRVCGCFPARWEARTNRLERLALRVSLLRDGRAAHDALGAISHIQGGLHDDQLASLSAAYKAAVQAAIDSCR